MLESGPNSISSSRIIESKLAKLSESTAGPPAKQRREVLSGLRKQDNSGSPVKAKVDEDYMAMLD